MGKPTNKQLTNSKFGPWGWSMILYAFLLYYFWAGLSVDALNVYPEAFAALHGWDPNVLLGFATPAGIIGVLGGIVFGRLIMKTGARNLSAVTLIVTGLIYILFGRVSSPTMFLVCLTLFTFMANAFGLIVTSTLMNNWFPRKKGIALGWATMGAPLCTATFVAILSGLFGKFGVPTGCTIVGVVIVFGGASFLWVKNYPHDVGAYPDNIRDEGVDLKAQAEAVHHYKSPFTLGKLLRDKDMWCMGLGFGLLWMVTVGIVSQFVPRMISVGNSQPAALMMLTVAAVVGLFGSYFWGWLDQKIGTKTASVIYSASYIIALLLLIFAKLPIFTYIAIVFVGLGIGGLLNLMPSMVISVYGKYDFTAANSLVSPIASLLQKFAFLIMAVLLGVSGGDYALPYGVFIVIDVIGAALLLCVTGKCKGKQD